MALSGACCTITRLGRDRRGGAMTVFALALLPLIAAAGLAADGMLGMLARSELSRAVDAAALAGAKAVDSPTRDMEIARLFAMNFPQGRLGVSVDPLSISANPRSGTVQVTATGTMPTRLMKLFDSDEIRLKASATAERGGIRTGIELALVLDVTGSMNEIDRSDPERKSKLTGLKRAASSLLDIVYQGNNTLPNLWVSVVPFAGRVNVKSNTGPADRGWGTAAAGRNWEGCFDVRYGRNAGNDEPPATERFPDFRPWGSTHHADHYCPDARVQPLTASKGTVKAVIDGLVAEGNTRTDIGLAWGWRVISPKWRGQWGTEAQLPLDYHEKDNSKVVVLMTDGMNTPDISGDPESKAATERNLARECEAMKAQGITIYTILFQTPSELIPLYSRCASSDETFIVAASNRALDEAFGRIGMQLRNKYVRLTQ